MVVWGIPVPMKPNGQRNWPETIKSMAAEKVSTGATILGLAEEICSNKSLVAKWVPGIPSKRGSGKFVEVFDVLDTGHLFSVFIHPFDG